MRRSMTWMVLCLVGLLGCLSCSSSDPAIPGASSIDGAWGLQSIDLDDGVRIYSRLDSLSGDQDGYLFGSDGVLQVRNAGPCGTPPLTFSNYEGSWAEQALNHLVLMHDLAGELREFSLVILSLDEHELRCRVEEIE